VSSLVLGQKVIDVNDEWRRRNLPDLVGRMFALESIQYIDISDAKARHY
jgi:hypothetical protein